jgi:halocyanin-like protein
VWIDRELLAVAVCSNWTDTMHSMTRRQFAHATAGMATLGATATVSAQESPDYGGWFGDVSNFDGTVDKRGQDSVEITVGAEGNNGAFAFGPAAVMVTPGTEVVWKWTGNGGGHNVKSADGGPLDSGSLVSEAGTTYSHTFESDGIYKYVCTPHKGLGMKGAVVVRPGTASGGSQGSESTATTADGEPSGESTAAETTESHGGGGPSPTGPLGAFATVIVMAFFSPLAFAALLRRKTSE